MKQKYSNVILIEQSIKSEVQYCEFERGMN